MQDPEQHLHTHWGPNPPCPYCGNTDWHVGESVRLVAETVEPRAELLLVPLHLVGCGRCGHTTFVRADRVSESR